MESPFPLSGYPVRVQRHYPLGGVGLGLSRPYSGYRLGVAGPLDQAGYCQLNGPYSRGCGRKSRRKQGS